jgi:hypothetical protein
VKIHAGTYLNIKCENTITAAILAFFRRDCCSSFLSREGGLGYFILFSLTFVSFIIAFVDFFYFPDDGCKFTTNYNPGTVLIQQGLHY